MFKAVRDSDWSARHSAAHDVTLDKVREAILERLYWSAPGRDGTTLVYGQTYAGRYLLAVAVDEGGQEMEHGTWVEPQPMATTSLRLPADVISQLKRQVQARHIRYTTYVRSILEHAANGTLPPEIADITERLDRIEHAVTACHGTIDQKLA